MRPVEGSDRYAWMYKTKTWRKLRECHLAENPLCAECWKRGRTVVASIVHHLTAHKGQWHLFVDLNNLEAVCAKCHDGDIRETERNGYSNRIGVDGWPVDANHPANRS
jgi:5-methylcytosine-specific restriction endonuclease McrA